MKHHVWVVLDPAKKEVLATAPHRAAARQTSYAFRKVIKAPHPVRQATLHVHDRS